MKLHWLALTFVVLMVAMGAGIGIGMMTAGLQQEPWHLPQTQPELDTWELGGPLMTTSVITKYSDDRVKIVTRDPGIIAFYVSVGETGQRFHVARVNAEKPSIAILGMKRTADSPYQFEIGDPKKTGVHVRFLDFQDRLVISIDDAFGLPLLVYSLRDNVLYHDRYEDWELILDAFNKRVTDSPFGVVDELLIMSKKVKALVDEHFENQ